LNNTKRALAYNGLDNPKDSLLVVVIYTKYFYCDRTAVSRRLGSPSEVDILLEEKEKKDGSRELVDIYSS